MSAWVSDCINKVVIKSFNDNKKAGATVWMRSFLLFFVRKKKHGVLQKPDAEVIQQSGKLLLSMDAEKTIELFDVVFHRINR